MLNNNESFYYDGNCERGYDREAFGQELGYGQSRERCWDEETYRGRDERRCRRPCPPCPPPCPPCPPPCCPPCHCQCQNHNNCSNSGDEWLIIILLFFCWCPFGGFFF